MSDVTQTTLEAASRCPKCGEPGNHVGTRNLEVGQGKLLMYRCENERCQWNATEWPVQVTSNGTIPLTLRRPKHFNKLPDDGGATMRSLEAQLLAEQQTGGGEINSRYR